MMIDMRPKCGICHEGIDKDTGIINAWGKSYHFRCIYRQGKKDYRDQWVEVPE